MCECLLRPLLNYKTFEELESVTSIYKGVSHQNRNYLLECRTLVVQASTTRWVFWEPICISVPAGTAVRGCVQLQ